MYIFLLSASRLAYIFENHGEVTARVGDKPRLSKGGSDGVEIFVRLLAT